MAQTLPTDEVIGLGRTSLLHLPDGPELRRLEVNEGYWDERTQWPERMDGRLMSVFDYSATWTWWERHPVGDEFVYVITGRVDFLLDDDREQQSIALSPGEGTIVPQGVWHSAVLHRPSTMLFVTPTPARTEHRDVT